MREILLTKGKVALVDDADYVVLSRYKWHAAERAHTYYAAGRPRGERGPILMHRWLLNVPSTLDVDHKDGNGLNNCRANLRLCTPAQNACNRHKPWGSSKYLGVSWYKRERTWQTFYQTRKKNHFVGYFNSEVLAALAYDDAVERIHGSFARFNFPEVR